MSAPFATTLLHRFEQNGWMRLQPGQFLLVVRRMGANFSAKECASVVKRVGTDDQGFVNIHGFCEWFENIENEPRLAQFAQSSSASGAIDRVVEEDSALDAHPHSLVPSMTGNEFESLSQQDRLGEDVSGELSENAVETETEHNINADARSDVEDDEAHDRVGGLRQRRREVLNLSVQFNSEVHSDDGLSTNLGSMGEDKFTLPSHRKLSEHEKLMASFRSDLVEVKARLQSGPVEYRADVTRTPCLAPE
eukprot:TRINITY_DN2634_c1_g4_i3.p1 TRINITY_DN2634_c1_g4~~TRINITY_DN2634_c1_g4_i3.p1  ORF type:complete len:250 (-),score=34.95 TRINITY_DN2634_c1_g4_i3:284-1033(-)